MGQLGGLTRFVRPSRRIMRNLTVIFLTGLLLLEATLAGDGNWPRFRGPSGAGVASGDRVPSELNDRTRAWSTSLAGPGSSSPVVWGQRVFVTSEERSRGLVHLHCFGTEDGKALWKKTVEVGPYRTHKMNNTAAATPAVNGNMVVFSWYDSGRKMAVLSACSHEGKDLWNYDVGPFEGAHGLNVVPAIHQGSVIIAHLHQRGGYVASLAGRTGIPLWKRMYPEPSPKTTYMTPLIRRRHVADGPEYEVVVSSTSIGVRGLDFESGRELWSLPDVFDERCIVSPVDILAGSGNKESLLTVGCKQEGGNNVFLAVRPPDAAGGKAEVAWQLGQHAPYVPTPVSDGKTLFVLSDRGVLQAVDPYSGKARWEKKFQGNFYGSPILLGNRLFCLSRDGEAYVLEVGGEARVLAVSDLSPGEEVTWVDASPALANDSLYLRVGARLDCYRSR
ncbi:MAG: hypothetical protein CMN03_13290 [Roseibacillus sp.]|nr:hypothetical protein [Roseibacillus sp.]